MKGGAGVTVIWFGTCDYLWGGVVTDGQGSCCGCHKSLHVAAVSIVEVWC